MNKKADVNWVIIGMIIALIVLFVVAYIFSTQASTAKKTIEGLSDCKSRSGGDCYSKEQSKTLQNYECFLNLGGCPPKEDATKEYCCIPTEK